MHGIEEIRYKPEILMSSEIQLPKTDFAERIVELNGLKKAGFREWVFYPGMLFSSNLWWGEEKNRRVPHEGLDLALFGNDRNEAIPISPGFVVPAAYPGELTAVSHDFLGMSLFVVHDFRKLEHILCSIYAHMKPRQNFRHGRLLEGGEPLGGICDPGLDSGIPAHLHLSLAWVPEKLAGPDLTWKQISPSEDIIFLNPLHIIGLEYKITRPERLRLKAKG